MTDKATVRAIAYHLPERQLGNRELAADCGDWDATKILQKTGIASRRIARAEECASDLGVAAAKQLFEGGACSPSDVDFLVFCTQTPDYVMPPTSCLVQDRLGLATTCGAIDLNLGCSAFVYGLAVAKGLIETGVAANVLLITAETYSKWINRRDRSARTIFSDGAAATLISSVRSETDLLGPFVFGTDGRGVRHIVVPAGGARRPLSNDAFIETSDSSGNWRSPRDFYMNGPEVFNFVLSTVPRAFDDLLKRWGRGKEEVDRFVLHQASGFMLEHLRKKLKIPEEKFAICLEDCGNTVSSTIPIALKEGQRDGTIKNGDNVAILAFGVGYSWGGAMMRMPPPELRYPSGSGGNRSF